MTFLGKINNNHMEYRIIKYTYPTDNGDIGRVIYNIQYETWRGWQDLKQTIYNKIYDKKTKKSGWGYGYHGVIDFDNIVDACFYLGNLKNGEFNSEIIL